MFLQDIFLITCFNNFLLSLTPPIFAPIYVAENHRGPRQ